MQLQRYVCTNLAMGSWSTANTKSCTAKTHPAPCMCVRVCRRTSRTMHVRTCMQTHIQHHACAYVYADTHETQGEELTATPRGPGEPSIPATPLGPCVNLKRKATWRYNSGAINDSVSLHRGQRHRRFHHHLILLVAPVRTESFLHAHTSVFRL